MPEKFAEHFIRHGIACFQDAVSGPSIAQRGLSLSLAPHTDRLRMQSAGLSGRQFVFHNITRELATLPALPNNGKWVMDFDGGGMAFLHDMQDDEEGAMLWVEDILQVQLYQDPNGRLAIVRRGEGGNGISFAVWYDEYRLAMDTAHLKFSVTGGQSNVSLRAIVYRIPRCGSRVYVSLYDFLGALSLGVIEKEKNVSHFVYKGMPRWERFMAESMGLPEQIARSAQYKSSKAYAGEDPDRKQKDPQLSVAAMVAMLARWSACATEAGGLKNNEDRASAKRVLLTLSTAGAGKSWRFGMFMNLNMWVDGIATGRLQVQWEVSETGDIVLSQDMWKEAFEDLLPGVRDIVCIVDLLCYLAETPKRFVYLKQVVIQVAKRWERNLFLQVSGPLPDGCKVRFGLGHDFENLTQVAIAQSLTSYWSTGVEWAMGRTHFSVTVGKSRVGGRGKQNGAEFRDYNAPALPEADGTTDGKGSKEVVAERQERHRNYLKRKAPGEWKSVKRHRLSAFHWGKALDHQLQVSTGRSLAFFKQEALLEKRLLPALQWPKCTVAMDLGPDGVSFMNFARFREQLNMELTPDSSHGVHNGADEALAACGLRGHMFLLMMAINTPHGPWSEDQRFVQRRNVVTELLSAEVPELNVLFQDYFGSILTDREESYRVGEQGLEQEIWSSLESPFEKKGKKLNKSRFMGIHHEGWGFVRTWHSRVMIQMHLCLEMNWLRSKHFAGLKPAKLDNEADMDASMKSSAAAAAKALRQSAGNALVATTLWMSDSDNYWRTKVALTMCKGWEDWHSDQNSRLRSAAESEAWFLEQCNGNYLETQSKTFGVMGDIGSLIWCGCTISFQGKPPELESEVIMRDDDTAHLMGKLSISLARVRCRWGLFFLRGWPAKMLGALGHDDSHDSLLGTLRSDVQNFEMLKARPPWGVAEQVVKRHVLQTVPAQQIVKAVEEAGGTIDEPLLAWMRDDVRRFWGSQLVEDSFKRESRRVQVKSNTVSSRETQLHHLLKTAVISEVHHYVEPSGNGIVDRNHILPQEHYQEWSCKPSLKDMGAIIGKKQATEWYSPPASGLHTPYADLAFIEQAVKGQAIADMDKTWQNHFLDGSGFLIRRKRPRRGPWLFPLGSFGSTAALGWPALRRSGSTARGRSALCFAPDESVKSLCDEHWLCLLNMADYEAVAYEWRSIAWQQASWGEDFGQIVAVCGAVKSMLEVAAEACFWDFPRSVLVKVAAEEGVAVSSGDTTFEVLMKLVQKILQCDEDRCLDILKRRAGPNEVCLEEFLAADAGLEVLDKSDEKSAKKAQNNAEAAKEEYRSFRKSHKARRKTRAAAKAKAMSRPTRARGSRATASSSRDVQPPAIPEGAPEQWSMKVLAPPGSYIWRELVRGGWAIHFPPYRRLSSSWKLYGSRGAAIRCLQYAWRLYMEDNALEECPVQGLMEEEVSIVTE